MPGFHFENRFSAEDDAKIIHLKEKRNLPWADIANHFEGRSKGSLQVRYSRTLKPRQHEPSAVYNSADESAGDSNTSSDDPEADEATTENTDIDMEDVDTTEGSENNGTSSSNKSANSMKESDDAPHQRGAALHLEYTSSDDNLTEIDEEKIAKMSPAHSAAAQTAKEREISVERQVMPPTFRNTRRMTAAGYGRIHSFAVNENANQPAEAEELTLPKGWHVVGADFVAAWAKTNPTSWVPKAFLDPSPKRQIEFNYQFGSFRTRTREEFLLGEAQGYNSAVPTRLPPQRKPGCLKSHEYHTQRKPISKSVLDSTQKPTRKRKSNIDREFTVAPVPHDDDQMSDTDDANSTTLRRAIKIVPSQVALGNPRLSSKTTYDKAGNARSVNTGLWAGEGAAGVMIPTTEETESDDCSL